MAERLWYFCELKESETAYLLGKAVEDVWVRADDYVDDMFDDAHWAVKNAINRLGAEDPELMLEEIEDEVLVPMKAVCKRDLAEKFDGLEDNLLEDLKDRLFGKRHGPFGNYPF